METETLEAPAAASSAPTPQKLTLTAAERADLLAAVQTVAGATPKKTTIDALHGVLMDIAPDPDAGGSIVTLTGSNLDLEATSRLPIAACARVQLLVNARRLGDLLDRLPALVSTTINWADPAALAISAGPVRAKLPRMDPHAFPLSKMDASTGMRSIAAGALHQMLAQVEHAAAVHDVRYYLNTVHIAFGADGTMTVAATDGHRLARAVVSTAVCNPLADAPTSCLLPRPSAELLIGVLKDAAPEQMVQLHLSERLARIEIGATTITTTLTDGRYPDIDRVIPKTQPIAAIVARKRLLEALSIADSVMSASKVARPGAVLTFHPGGTLTIQATNSLTTHQSAEDTIEVAYEDAPAEPDVIGLAIEYLEDAIKAISGDSVRIACGDAHAISITPHPMPEGMQPLLLVMPMRV